MLNAVLFDLDNTLIRFSERDFIDGYVSQVSEAFSDIMPRDESAGDLGLEQSRILWTESTVEIPTPEFAGPLSGVTDVVKTLASSAGKWEPPAAWRRGRS